MIHHLSVYHVYAYLFTERLSVVDL